MASVFWRVYSVRQAEVGWGEVLLGRVPARGHASAENRQQGRGILRGPATAEPAGRVRPTKTL